MGEHKSDRNDPTQSTFACSDQAEDQQEQLVGEDTDYIATGDDAQRLGDRRLRLDDVFRGDRIGEHLQSGRACQHEWARVDVRRGSVHSTDRRLRRPGTMSKGIQN